MSGHREQVLYETGFSAFSGGSFDGAYLVWDSVSKVVGLEGLFKGDSTVPSVAGTPIQFAVIGATAPAPVTGSNPVGTAVAKIGSAYVPGIVFQTYEGFLSVQFNVSGTISFCAVSMSYGS